MWGRAICSVTLVVALCTSARATAPDERAMSLDEARRILAAPKGSTSLGTTSSGSLRQGEVMPPVGPGWALLDHIRDRRTFFGTAEMIGLLRRTAVRLHEAVPGTVMRIGNIGLQAGGKCRWSVSHQAGRDADLAIFAVDRRGRPAKLRDYVHFDKKGQARSGRLRFDPERNLALMKALLEDEEVTVQWVFVAEWLQAIMLDHARARGFSREWIARLDAVMRQPSDSRPHNDHFHVRIYCSIQDRLHGCLDRPPYREGLDRGEARFAKRVADLEAVATMPRPRLRARAVQMLGAIRAHGAIDTLVGALEDDVRKVRQAAWSALRLLSNPASLTGISRVLARTEDPNRAAAFFSLIGHIGTPRAAPVARDILEAPRSRLHPKVARRIPVDMQLTAAKILERHGRKDAARPLLALLGSRHGKVRQAAHEALRRVTNRDVRGEPRSRSKKRRARLVKRWTAFLDAHERASWLQWMRLGFEERGFRFRGKMMSHASIPTLIRAVGHRDVDASHNAVRVLCELTGHVVDPRWRSRRRNLDYWRSWWADNRTRYSGRSTSTTAAH